MPLVLRYAARSDVGLVRRGNEDSGYAGPRLLVVADGMGGHAAGELASASAVAAFAELDRDGFTTDDILAALDEAVQHTHDVISRVSVADASLTGMGTTLTALAWRDGRMALAHVGDSRAYLLRDGALVQLSHDHTFVQTLVDAGRITPEQASTHERRHLLMRAIDGQHEVEPDLSLREAHAGDRYLLCSDGLSGVMTDADIAGLLALPDPTGVVTALVERALEAGAPDNVTVVVADVVDLDDATAPAIDLAEAVVVGAAGEQRNRERLGGMEFPHDAQPDPDRSGTDLSSVDPARDPASGRVAGLVVGPGFGSGSPGFRGQRSPWPRRVLILGFLVAILAGITTAAVVWTRDRVFVGESGGQVAVFNGLPNSFLGRDLYSVVETSTVAVTSLPLFAQEQVRATIPVGSVNEARDVVGRLAAQAAECAADPALAGCSEDPGVEPLPSPAGSPTSPAPSVGQPSTSAPPSTSTGAASIAAPRGASVPAGASVPSGGSATR